MKKFKINTIKEYPAKNTYRNDDIHELFKSIQIKKGKIIKIDFIDYRDKENFRMILNNKRREGTFTYPFCKKGNSIYIDMRTFKLFSSVFNSK